MKQAKQDIAGAGEWAQARKALWSGNIVVVRKNEVSPMPAYKELACFSRRATFLLTSLASLSLSLSLSQPRCFVRCWLARILEHSARQEKEFGHTLPPPPPPLLLLHRRGDAK
jgi:hypothetical protein